MSAQQERKRTLYISSENVDFFTSSDRITISLTENISANDGYNLAYSLKQIGFNSTAFNISEAQKNNRISFVLDYDISNVTATIVDSVKISPLPNDPLTYEIYKHSGHPEYNDALQLKKQKIVECVVPDGLYTFDLLLDYLSTNFASNDSLKWVIPSGYIKDARNSHNDINNIVSLALSFKETISGYTISFLKDLDEIQSFYSTTTYPTDTFYTRDLFPRLTSFSIIPSPSSPNLFNMLFTNFNTSYQPTPISTPADMDKTGLNPPNGVKFVFVVPPGDDELFDSQPLNYDVNVVELGNENIYDVPNGIYPTSDKINYHKYIAYYKPVLDPVYIDVGISLPNYAMDERGHKNILTRIFTLGAKDGNSSLFMSWDNPKLTILDGTPSFSTITIDLSSQGDKYNFYNSEFTMELEICEIREEQPEDNPLVNVQIPPTDPISDAARVLSTQNFGYQTRGVQVHKRSRYV